MAPATGPYRHEGDVALIELRLARIDQLFASIDPAPFRQRDLDPAAEEYVVEAARDFPHAAALKLVIHLPSDRLADAAAADVDTAVHAYFRYRVWTEERRLRHLLRTGALSLAIGTTFLMACVGLRRLVAGTWRGAVAEIVGEGLVISGWVALWRPIQIFLYDWWPIRRSARLYAKLATIPVECRGGDPTFGPLVRNG